MPGHRARAGIKEFKWKVSLGRHELKMQECHGEKNFTGTGGLVRKEFKWTVGIGRHEFQGQVGIGRTVFLAPVAPGRREFKEAECTGRNDFQRNSQPWKTGIHADSRP